MRKPSIVDIRCRMAIGADGDYFRAKLGARAPRSVREGNQDAFFRELDEAGVRTAVAPSGNNQGMTVGYHKLPPRTTSNDEQSMLQGKYPGRFVGVGAIDVSNTAHNALSELERCVNDLGLRVVTIEPGRAPLNAPHPADKRLYDFYDLAAKSDTPVILQTSGLLGGKNIDYAHPRWIDQIAGDFPALTIICGHGCYPFVREAISVAVRRGNVYLAPDLYLFWPGTEDWVKAVNQGRIANSFVFGSGYPLIGNLRRFVRRFLSLNWKNDYLPNLLYKNALRALQLDSDLDFEEIRKSASSFRLQSMVWSAARRVAAIARPWKFY